MKKIALFFIGLVVATSTAAWANEQDMRSLQSRLEKLTQLEAKFTQVISSPDGGTVQKGAGELYIKRPNLFNWAVKEPDESSIISDGKTIWMYTPLLEQVTASDINALSDNVLMLLISNNSSDAWQNYDVTRKQNTYYLKPKNPDNQTYQITVLATGMIANFTIIESDGQKGFYDLSHQSLKPFNNSYFQFTVPQGVTLDDQRKKK